MITALLSVLLAGIVYADPYAPPVTPTAQRDGFKGPVREVREESGRSTWQDDRWVITSDRTTLLRRYDDAGRLIYRGQHQLYNTGSIDEYHYDAEGRMLTRYHQRLGPTHGCIVSPRTDHVAYTYGSDGQLVRIFQTIQMPSLTSPAEEEHRFTYWLISVIRYDQHGRRIEAETIRDNGKSQGQAVERRVKWQYDGQGREIAQITLDHQGNETGRVTRTYTEDGGLLIEGTDRLSQTTERFDARGRTIETSRILHLYDEQEQQERTVTAYSDKGKEVTREFINLRGGTVESTYTHKDYYDVADKLLMRVTSDPSGLQSMSVYAYDTRGNLNIITRCAWRDAQRDIPAGWRAYASPQYYGYTYDDHGNWVSLIRHRVSAYGGHDPIMENGRIKTNDEYTTRQIVYRDASSANAGK
jgi:hypothetical protein